MQITNKSIEENNLVFLRKNFYAYLNNEFGTLSKEQHREIRVMIKEYGNTVAKKYVELYAEAGSNLAIADGAILKLTEKLKKLT